MLLIGQPTKHRKVPWTQKYYSLPPATAEETAHLELDSIPEMLRGVINPVIQTKRWRAICNRRHLESVQDYWENGYEPASRVTAIVCAAPLRRMVSLTVCPTAVLLNR